MAGLSPDVYRAPQPGVQERLGSWKEIAVYLKRSVATAQRWEKTEGLCVHRHQHSKLGSVYAYKSELDDWWNSRRAQLESTEALPARSRWRFAWAAVLVVGLALVVVLLTWNLYVVDDRVLAQPVPGEISSIAVLPLENLSGDPQQAYFADGMTEALIMELGKIRSLRVISRTSVMKYKDIKKPLAEIASELNVAALVEGSVVREDGRVAVTAQLIQARPERQLWSKRFERDLAGVVALQSDLARAIAGEIRVKLTPQERASLAQGRSVNPEAYEAYLKGHWHWRKGSGQALPRARAYFEEAIKKDPGYAPAYVGLANTYAWSYRWPRPLLAPPGDTFPVAAAAVRKALELDDTLAEAHASLAYIKEAYEWDWSGAEKEYRRAIELNPSYPEARHWYALYLAAHRRFDEAIAEIKRAEELDPLSRATKRAIGWVHYRAGQFDRAIEQWQMTLELEQDFPHAHYALAVAYTQKGMYEDAIRLHLREIALYGKTTRSMALLAHAYGKAGQTGQALKILAELKERAKRDYISGQILAMGYMGLGDKEEALRLLEQAFRERDPALTTDLNTEANWWDPLRPDPRFQDILRRMGLTPR